MMYLLPELNTCDYIELIDDRARVSRTPLKNACGVPRETYSDGFLTIESGKTLTFIVEEFLNDLACK